MLVANKWIQKIFANFYKKEAIIVDVLNKLQSVPMTIGILSVII